MGAATTMGATTGRWLPAATMEPAPEQTLALEDVAYSRCRWSACSRRSDRLGGLCIQQTVGRTKPRDERHRFCIVFSDFPLVRRTHVSPTSRSRHAAAVQAPCRPGRQLPV